MQLSRSAIAAAALEILDTYGLGDVSMRRIASSLGVAPGALYWHVDSKQDLVAAMAELIVSPVLENPPTHPREFTQKLRAALMAHRDGAEVVTAAAAHPSADIYRRLVEVGMKGFGGGVDKRSRDAAEGLLLITLGGATVHQSAVQYHGAEASPAADTSGAIELLLAGLEDSELRAPRLPE